MMKIGIHHGDSPEVDLVSIDLDLICRRGKMMVSTWKPCGFHLETMWCPHCNHVVSTWKPHGFHMETKWCPHRNHMVSMTCLECSLKLVMLFLWVEIMSFSMVRHHKMGTMSFPHYFHGWK